MITDDDPLRAALAILRENRGYHTDPRVSRMEQVLADHERASGCLFGDRCRTLTEARELVAGDAS